MAKLTEEELIKLGISPDGVCVMEGCNNSLMVKGKQEYKQYCRECKKKRAEYFRLQYRKEQGWDEKEPVGKTLHDAMVKKQTEE